MTTDIVAGESRSARVTRREATATLGGLLLCGLLPAAAQAPALTGQDGWIRERRQSRTETAAFAVLINSSREDRAVVSATVALAETVELHETRMSDGRMRMMPVTQIVVPAGGRVELKPGGLHLMLFGVTS